MCLSCICLLATHTLICVTFSLPPGVRGWLLVTLPGLFCLHFYGEFLFVMQTGTGGGVDMVLGHRSFCLSGTKSVFNCVSEDEL